MGVYGRVTMLQQTCAAQESLESTLLNPNFVAFILSENSAETEMAWSPWLAILIKNIYTL